ncbi:hypothetical protein PV04_09420 [Phialophora macrospora]|uniref:BZIP domain-containing protein n=1 Tax=Phialophora macrospora TaxID=1851006 RepID=A0A0D2CH48_9EURO|nr:hypothetical protein PV04_09420 [Phialophora macrospora]
MSQPDIRGFRRGLEEVPAGRMTVTISSSSALSPAGVRRSTGDDWTGISDRKRRKQLQNRLNQRAFKERRRQEKLATAFGPRERPRVTYDALLENQSIILAPRDMPSGVPSLGYRLMWYPKVLGDPIVREVVSFARDTLWPTFSSSTAYPGFTPSLNEIWFHRILNVPIMRHAVISGTCIDLELLTGRRYSSTILSTVIELSREVRRLLSRLPPTQTLNAIGEHRQGLSDGQASNLHADNYGEAAGEAAQVKDDLLFAVMHLVKASTINLSLGFIPPSSFDTAAGVFGLFTPPLLLQRLQSLHLWGRSCPLQHQGKESDTQTAQHFSALESLVSLKGGLRGIHTPGFAEALHLFDVIVAAKRLNKPRFELPGRSVWFLRLIGGLRGEGVHALRMIPFRSVLDQPSLLEILTDIHILCSWVSDALSDQRHHDGTENPLSAEDMSTLRNSIEYRLLKYSPESDDVIEKLAHTAALMFMHGVLLPLPTRAPMTRLTDGLIETILRQCQHDESPFISLGEPKFFAWVVMMGAMATSDAEIQERTFLVEQLARFLGHMHISNWRDLKMILEEYLWVDWGCDLGGMVVWSMLGAHGNHGGGEVSAI